MGTETTVEELRGIIERRDKCWEIINEWVVLNNLDFSTVSFGVKDEQRLGEQYEICNMGNMEVTRNMSGKFRKFTIGFVVTGTKLGFIIELFRAPGDQDETFHKTIREINAELGLGSIIHYPTGEVIFMAQQVFSKNIDLDLLNLIVDCSFHSISEHIPSLDFLQYSVIEKIISEPGYSQCSVIEKLISEYGSFTTDDDCCGGDECDDSEYCSCAGNATDVIHTEITDEIPGIVECD